MRLAFFSILIAFIFSLSIDSETPVAPAVNPVSKENATTTPASVTKKPVQKAKVAAQQVEKISTIKTTATTSSIKRVVPEQPQVLPQVFTAATLARYDGSETSLPVLIAMEGNVYDVSAGRSYYEPGGAYHFLAGTDGTTLLQAIGGDIIKRKYPVVGTFSQ